MNKSLFFIVLTVLIDVMGIAIIIPIIPDLIRELTGEDISGAASYGGWLEGSYALMAFIFSPILGELSDRYGRRPILLISLLGLGIDYIFHAYATSVLWLFVGRFIAGIFGASFSVANAYIADISTKENKAKNFGLIGVAFGVGFMLGPVIGGILGEYGTRLPFIFSAGLSLANFLFGLFFIPESLAKEKQRPINYKKMIPFVSFANLAKYKALFGLIVAYILANLAGQVMHSTWSFFTMEAYGWSKLDVGISLGIIGLLVGFVQGGLIGWSVKKFGNKKVIITGFLLWTVGVMLMAFAFKPWLFYGFIPFYILGGIASPTLQSIISNQVPENEQGNLQGTLTSAVSLMAFIGPLMFTETFSYFTNKKHSIYFAGAAFILAGFVLLIALFTVVRSLKGKEID